jgi:co-chaperonin GroES (HSP10)
MVEKVKLVKDNILVFIKMPNNETEGGIVLNKETARELQQTITGEVLHIGPDVTDFEVGDTILLPPHGHTAVAIDKEVYHIFRETSLFGKIEK